MMLEGENPRPGPARIAEVIKRLNAVKLVELARVLADDRMADKL